MRPMRIDLHTHSRVSDGTDTPTMLVMKAFQAGLDVIALTDHDTSVSGSKKPPDQIRPMIHVMMSTATGRMRSATDDFVAVDFS